MLKTGQAWGEPMLARTPAIVCAGGPGPLQGPQQPRRKCCESKCTGSDFTDFAKSWPFAMATMAQPFITHDGKGFHVSPQAVEQLKQLRGPGACVRARAHTRHASARWCMLAGWPDRAWVGCQPRMRMYRPARRAQLSAACSRRALNHHARAVAVLAVCGRARQGKSWLLNQILGKLTAGYKNAPAGFQVASTHRPCTKGLWLWGQALARVTPSGQQYHLVGGQGGVRAP